MTLKERNYAGDHVVVGSLEVLGSVKGGNITEIKRNIALIQQQTEFMGRQQNEYWAELSSDGVITPIEKQQLLKEIRQIQQSQAAIIIQARSVGQEESQYVQDYLTVYDDLYTYLYNTLKLFDNMEQNTDIKDRNTFNNKFTAYYYDESFVLIALTKGIMSSLNIRVLTSLLEEGEEGEVAIYRGGLYQYVNGAWKNVSTGNYKGALTALPTAEQDAFFLAADDFLITDILYVNDEPLYVNNEELGVMRLYRKGYIYYCHDNLWYEETDKTNYMYVAAFADVLNITGELPQIFQDALDDLQDQIDDLGDDIDGLENTLYQRAPRYRGAQATDPTSPVEGDYFVYTGATTAYRKNSDIYKYTSGAWTELDPQQSQNSIYYMNALEDILSLNNADNGYFGAIFAQMLIASDAFMDALTTKTINLLTNGYIKSNNYDSNNPESAGFRIGYDGNADFNGNTHIAGKVAIGVPLRGNSNFDDYDVVIGGNTLINGVMKAVRFEIVGVQAGDVVQREYNDIFDVANTQSLYNITTITRGTMRIKISYNVTELGGQGYQSPYIQIGNDKTVFTQTGSGTLVKDISFTEYQNIRIIISDIDEPILGGGYIKVSSIKLCLSEDDSIFKAFTQFILINSYEMRGR